MNDDLTQSQKEIAALCDRLKETLLSKNRKYGDSALSPVRILSKIDAVDGIDTRLDDKLNRIKNAQDDEDEDPSFDAAGYFVLRCIAIARRKAAAEKKTMPEQVAEHAAELGRKELAPLCSEVRFYPLTFDKSRKLICRREAGHTGAHRDGSISWSVPRKRR